MNKFKRIAKAVWFHTLVLLKGLKRVVLGATTAGLIAFAVYGFRMIPTEGGYAAVLDFVAAIATMTLGMLCMYAMGAGYKRGAR